MATLGKSTKKRKLTKKPKTQTPTKKKPKPPITLDDDYDVDDEDPLHQPTDSDSDSDSGSDDHISSLLEPYSKPQLIDLICDAAARDSTLLSRIRDLADRDDSHRKIFVHGLAWDASTETLTAAFARYGEIEQCHVVLDKNTGKTKGYGFVVFKTRKGASKALRNPHKKINSRVATCQLASVGPPPSSAATKPDAAASSWRKIYVGNVPPDVDVVKFKEFFARFGEIETGPIGFDVQSGKSRGFALFVYKTSDGFENALREPYKLFEGHQLHCQKAETKGKDKLKPKLVVGPQAAQPQASQPMPLAMQMQMPMPIAPHGYAFYNPIMYGGGFIPGTVNPMAMLPAGQYGGYAARAGGSGGTVASGIQPVYPSTAGAQFGGSSSGAGSYSSSL